MFLSVFLVLTVWVRPSYEESYNPYFWEIDTFGTDWEHWWDGGGIGNYSGGDIVTLQYLFSDIGYEHYTIDKDVHINLNETGYRVIAKVKSYGKTNIDLYFHILKPNSETWDLKSIGRVNYTEWTTLYADLSQYENGVIEKVFLKIDDYYQDASNEYGYGYCDYIVFSEGLLDIKNAYLNVTEVLPNQYFRCNFNVYWRNNTIPLENFKVEVYINDSYVRTVTNENYVDLRLTEYTSYASGKAGPHWVTLHEGNYVVKLVAVDTEDSTYKYKIPGLTPELTVRCTQSYDGYAFNSTSGERSFLSLFENVVVLFAFFFTIGYLLIRITGVDRFLSSNFFVRLPFYLIVGMSGTIITLHIVAWVLIDQHVLMMLFLTCLSSSLILYLKKRGKLDFEQIKFSQLRHNLVRLDYALPLALFLFSLFYFLRVAHDMIVIPIADPFSHSMTTSLILYNKRIPTTHLPILDFPYIFWYYPRGLHLLSSVVSLLTGTYPAQAYPLFAAFISMLMPSLLYSVTYIKTKSPIVATISFLMAYIIPGMQFIFDPSHDLLISNIINGTYACHLGNLLLISTFGIAVCLDPFPHSSELKFFSQPWLRLYAISAVSVILSYYPYAFFVIIYPLFRFLFSLLKGIFWKRHVRDLLSPRNLVYLCFIIFMGFALVNVFSTLYPLVIDILFPFGMYPPGYYLELHYFFSNENGIIILASSLMILAFLLKKKHHSLVLAYLSLFVPSMLALRESFFVNYLWIITPDRIIIPLTALSYVSFSVGVHFFLIRIGEGRKSSRQRTMLNLINRSKLKAAFLCLLAASILSVHLSFVPSAYMWASPVGADFEALEWIVKNTAPEDLVLTDRSFEGFGLQAFRPQNAVYVYWLESRAWRPARARLTLYTNRSIECRQILEDPLNYALMKHLITKYQIKYVYISSNPFYRDYDAGGVDEYRNVYRKWEQPEYVRIFDRNPWLQVVFRGRNVRVYKTFIVP